MSVYDFNHSPSHQQEHQHTTNGQHAGNGISCSNGIGLTSRYQHRNQVDNDYLNRTNHNLSNDMSGQVTRPTSKTALLVRQRRAMLEQLSCYLCKGYLIDATTVYECMDSFCKSCIVIYLRTHNSCPKCGTLIHKTNPMSAIRSDKVLQDIVYKLVPGLYDDEMKRRREFYRTMYAISSDESNDDEGSSSSSFGGRLSGEQYGVITHPKSFYKPTDYIDLSIEPQTRGGDNSTIYYDNRRQSIVTCFTGNALQQQQGEHQQIFSSVESHHFKTYLKCPAKLTALQLKKFIAAKFNICRDDTIHLLYLNESLRDDYSLIDIAYIYDWRGIEHMRLFYIIERDLGKSNYNDSNNNNQRTIETAQSNSSRGKTRQCVGTSTQTVKRVCIDPTPKYYEEQNNNVVNNGNSNYTNDNGRLMRSRSESSTSTNRVVATSQPPQQSPNLRSNLTNRAVTNIMPPTSNVNGVAKRNLVALGVQSTPTPLASAVTSAINELSRLKQEREAKQLRSSPKKLDNEVSPGGAIPKININQLVQSQSSGLNNNPTNSTYSKLNFGLGVPQKEVAVRQNNTSTISSSNQIINSNLRQVVSLKGFPAMTCLPGPSQSSMVTLASFTEARSNHVVAMSSSTATTMSNSYKNMIAPGTSSRYEYKQIEVKNCVNQATQPKPPQATPQIAFNAIVTERGVTLIRRLNNEEAAAANAAAASRNSPANNNNNNNTTTKASSTVPSLASTPTSQSSNNITSVQVANNSQSNYNQPTVPANRSTSTGTSVVGTSSGTSQQTTNTSSTGQDGISQRHLMKVKPVYKTFVDPKYIKLKSPNLKKLGR